MAIVPFLVLDVSAQSPILLNIEPDNITAQSGDNTYLVKDGDKLDRTLSNRHVNNFNNDTGGFYSTNTKTLESPIFKNSTSSCELRLFSAKQIITSTITYQGLAAPDNITPKGNDNLIAIGFDITLFGGSSTDQCNPDLEAPSEHQIITNKGTYFTLYNQSDKKAYYFEPRVNITQAQSIPICTTDNFNTSDNTLKGTTEMCYGKNGGNDMMIITKKPLGFYGAADSISTTTTTTSRDNVKGIGTNPLSDGLFNITTSAAGTGSIDTSGKYSYVAGGAKQKGHIYIPPDTTISDDLFAADDAGKTCIQGTAISSDYRPIFSRPSDVSDGTAYGFGYLAGGDSDTCTLKLSAFVGQFNTSNTLQVVLYDQAGKEGYYYNRGVDINTAQDIATCSSTNFDDTAKTLKGTTQHCYKDVGGDLVVYAKVIQMYGAKTAGDTGADINTVSRDGVYGIGTDINFNITTSAAGTGSIDTFGKYTWSAVGTQPKGHIYIPPDTTISDDLFAAGDAGKTCIQGTVISSDYGSIISRPSDVSDGTAYGFGYLAGADSNTCTLKSSAFIGQFNTSNTLQVVLYDQAGKEGYYYHPGVNINSSQAIAACSSTIFDNTAKTLKGTTQHCYSDVGDDLVIYTKIIQWYGAKTPSSLLTIPKPDDMPEPEKRGLTAAYNELKRDYWYIRENKTLLIETLDSSIGNVRVPSPDRLVLEQNPLLDNYKKHSVCPGAFQSVGSILKGDFTQRAGGINTVVNLKIPSNIEEQTNDTIIAGGINWSPSIESDTVQCPLDLEEQSNYPIFTTKELRYTLYNQSDKKAYHFSPRENILAAQPIPPCDNDNFDITDQTLKGDTKMCYGKHEKNMVIITKKLTGFYGATTSITVTNTSDDDGDMANAPTFGTSPLTGEQLVTCGYKMDDTCRDITAYHVQYERDVIQTNTTHTFALKALAPNMIDSFILAFGVPEIGSPVSAAEAYITAKLAVNYTSPSYYNIIDVIVHDPNNIIDYNITNTEVSRVSCSGGTLECSQVTFPDVLFRETLYHEPFVVMITDTLLYTSINYMNEGILVTGTPLNEQPTISPGITVDTGDTRPTKLVLVRTDKVNDLWEDAFGNTWSRNSFGNYVIVQYAPYAGTVPVCDDINDRLCAPFKAKLDWHNQRMIELRDSLYAAYTTKAYAEIDDIFTYEFGDMDSRTRTLINLGWLTE